MPDEDRESESALTDAAERKPAASAGEGGAGREVGAALYFASAAILIAILWGWFLLEQVTGLRLVRAGGTAQAEPVHVAFPLIGTPVVLLVAFVLWRRAAGIAAHGVEMDAAVRSVGGAVQGMRHVVLAYEFEGRSFEKKVSVVCAVSDKLSEGDTLRVLVDRRKPKRMMVV